MGEWLSGMEVFGIPRIGGLPISENRCLFDAEMYLSRGAMDTHVSA